MVKHTQTIRLSVFDHFVGLALKELRQKYPETATRDALEEGHSRK